MCNVTRKKSNQKPHQKSNDISTMKTSDPTPHKGQTCGQTATLTSTARQGNIPMKLNSERHRLHVADVLVSDRVRYDENENCRM